MKRALQITVESTNGKIRIQNKEILKRGDRYILVELTFTTDGKPVRLDAGYYICFGIRKLGVKLAESVLLASVDTWQRGSADCYPYTGVLDLSGEALNTLLGSQISLACHGEVTWEGPVGAGPYSSQTEGLNIQADVNREGDAPPVPSAGFAKRVFDLFVPGENTNITLDEQGGKITITATGGGVVELIAPDNLVATYNGDGTLDASWDPVEGADSYEYQIDAGPWVNIGNATSINNASAS